MQIKPDRVLHPPFPQLGRKRDQMIVVYPDDVVGTQQGFQQRRQPPVDRNKSLEKAGLELSEI